MDSDRIVSLNLFVNLLLGTVLTAGFGLAGAVATAMTLESLNFLQNYIACRNSIDHRLIDRSIIAPTISTVVMILTIAVLRSSGDVVASTAGAVIYVLVMLTSLAATHGGMKQLRQNYFEPVLRAGPS